MQSKNYGESITASGFQLFIITIIFAKDLAENIEPK